MKEFEIKYTKGTGSGGQHKNKVETCVVITHLPTGIKERCQDTRSKNQNLTLAKSRITKKIQAHYDKLVSQKKYEEYKKRIDNSKIIRTYNYNRNEVKDHRSKAKSELKKVLNGDLDCLK